METPIADFLRRYDADRITRFHMPGHKGKEFLGCEHLDITEVKGADALYEADGIIARSESIAARHFGAGRTLYSAEGSSQCIRAMLCLAAGLHRGPGRPLILAGRNVHKAFIHACALLDLDVRWLMPEGAGGGSVCSCPITPAGLERALDGCPAAPCAVYITAPDYLGGSPDIAALAAVCRQHGLPLLVDNAHGAYLRFLTPSRHPLDLGAAITCDSAHKTLPVLTGGAYLHLASGLPELFFRQAKNALCLFGSTSPSYLILQSLDRANPYLAEGYRERLAAFTEETAALKDRLIGHGYTLMGDEPLKLTLAAKDYGYSGTALAALLRERGIVCEFADPDFLVLMLTPEIGRAGLAMLEKALLSLPRRPALSEKAPGFCRAEKVMSIREASLSLSEIVPVSACAGRVLAAANVGCPPAVPIVVCGERIDEAALRCFAYYGIKDCAVVK